MYLVVVWSQVLYVLTYANNPCRFAKLFTICWNKVEQYCYFTNPFFLVCIVYCNRSQKTSQRIKNNSHATQLWLVSHFFVLYTLWRHLWSITVHTHTEKCNLFVNFKTATGQQTFYYKIVSMWNSLDSSLKLCESVDSFKGCLKEKLLQDLLNE